MAVQEQVNSISLPANADLSASQFCFVTLNTSGKLILPAAGGDCIGILQDKPDAADRIAQVAMLGTSGRLKVIAAATLTAGVKVQADAAGKAIAALTGDHVLGTTLTAAVSGELIEIAPGSRMLLP